MFILIMNCKNNLIETITKNTRIAKEISCKDVRLHNLFPIYFFGMAPLDPRRFSGGGI